VVKQYANLALLSFSEQADMVALARQLRGTSGVTFAEANYIFWLPEQDPRSSTQHTQMTAVQLASRGEPNDDLQCG